MPRVKRSVHARKKRRKVLGEAKGYWGLKKSNYTYAKEQVERSLAYAYRDRKVRKREFRKLWIMRINAGARAHGLSYNQFMHGLKAANVELDRKVLADLAVADPAKFGEIVEQAKSALAARRNSPAGGDLQPPGRLLRRPFTAVRGAVPPTRGRPAGRRHRSRPRLGLPAAAARRAALPRARRNEASWDDIGAALDRHAAFLTRWATEQDVQTNEVQRSWGLAAGVPLGRRRAAVRPARARPVGRAQPALGSLQLPLPRPARGATARSSSRATTGCRRLPTSSNGRSRSCGAAAST